MIYHDSIAFSRKLRIVVTQTDDNYYHLHYAMAPPRYIHHMLSQTYQWLERVSDSTSWLTLTVTLTVTPLPSALFVLFVTFPHLPTHTNAILAKQTNVHDRRQCCRGSYLVLIATKVDHNSSDVTKLSQITNHFFFPSLVIVDPQLGHWRAGHRSTYSAHNG